MKVNLSVNDVREISKMLVKENGDVFETSRKTNHTVDEVRRVKEKKYLKAISDQYFTDNTWSKKSTANAEPEPVQLVIDDIKDIDTRITPSTTDTTIPIDVKKNPNPKSNIDEETCRKICEKLVKGIGGSEIARQLGVKPQVVSDIKRKHVWVSVSKEYFDIDSDNNIIVKETGEKIMKKNSGPKRFCEEPLTTPNTPVTSVAVVDDAGDIIKEIEDLAVKYVTQHPIDKIPDPLKSKLIDVIKEEISEMTIKQIKELTHVK